MEFHTVLARRTQTNRFKFILIKFNSTQKSIGMLTVTNDSSRGLLLWPTGSYNHLNDAVLDVNTTRIMVMRRLRTLADAFLAGGRIQKARG